MVSAISGKFVERYWPFLEMTDIFQRVANTLWSCARGYWISEERLPEGYYITSRQETGEVCHINNKGQPISNNSKNLKQAFFLCPNWLVQEKTISPLQRKFFDRKPNFPACYCKNISLKNSFLTLSWIPVLHPKNYFQLQKSSYSLRGNVLYN
jgi:hypothetical protein